MRPAPKLKTVIHDFQSLINVSRVLIYDRRLIVRYVNASFCELSGFSPKSVIGSSVLRILFPKAEVSREAYRKAFNFDIPRNVHSVPLILKVTHFYENSSVERGSLEEHAGYNVACKFIQVSSDFMLVEISYRRMQTNNMLGKLLTDLYAAIDSRQRVVSFNERFAVNAKAFQTRIFNRPLGDFFHRHSYQQAVFEHRKAQDKIRQNARENRQAWEPVYTADKTRDKWQNGLLLEKNLRGRCQENALTFTSRYPQSFLIFDRPLDHKAFDLRWEIEINNPASAQLAFFFNGSTDCLDARITTPEIEGYTLAFSTLPASYFMIKRWLIEFCYAWGKKCNSGDRLKLAAEKCGGLFRLECEGKIVLELVDTQFERYGAEKYTGLIFSQLPTELSNMRLLARPGSCCSYKPQKRYFDLILKDHPGQIYEAEFFEHRQDRNNRNKLTHVLLRRVTELRHAEREILTLYRQKNKALEQAESRLEQINRELKMAATVLDSLVPKAFPELPNVRFYSYFQPSHHVGGDLFDVFRVDAHNVALLMHDVCGHGMPAALVSVMARTLFQKHFEPAKPLPELLDSIHNDLQTLQYDNDDFRYVTIFCGLLNHQTGELRYIGAGFPAPILLADANLILLETKGLPLGLSNLKPNSLEQRVTLGQKGKLLIFTDGLYEITASDGTLCKRSHFEGIIRNLRNQPLKEIFEATLAEHHRILGKNEATDDVTLLGVEIE